MTAFLRRGAILSAVPLKAILLAAGEGSRLRPFTVDKPKPMIRAANKPIAQHVIEALVANGVKDITFVLAYQRAKVQSHFGDGKKLGARISYAFQDALNGTAAAFATAPRPDGTTLVLGADNVVDASLIKSILSAPGDGPALVVRRSETPQRYGVVTLDGARVERVDEKPLQPKSDWINTGVYRLDRATHDRAKAAAEATVYGLPEVLQEAIADGVRVEAVKSEALWSDAVYPWDLLKVHAELFAAGHGGSTKLPGVHAEAPVLVGEDATIGAGTVLGAGTCIGENVDVGPGCILENCVVYDHARIGPGSVLRDTIVGEGASVGARFTAPSGPCEVRTADGWHRLDAFGSVIGTDARVGGAVTALPGTILGNRARVPHAKTLSGTIDDGAVIV